MMAAAHISVARSLTGGASSPYYDCAKCDALPGLSLKLRLGHDGPPVGGLWRENLLDDKRTLAECPRRTLLRAADESPALVNEMVRVKDVYLPAYRAGHLPTGGGTGDQPARTMAYLRQAEAVAALGEAARAKVEGTEGGA